jgi:hypothetical protein
MALLASTAGSASGAADRGNHRIFPPRSQQGAELRSLGAPQNVSYFGGPVIPNVKVYAVFWGPNVNAQIKSGIGEFYSAAVNSTYLDWMKVYDTNIQATGGKPGSNQHIGRGSFGGNVTIAPRNAGKKLDKKDVEVEIEYQIGQGALARPDDNTLYMIHFPAGITLTTGGMASCQSWCGDHEGFHSKAYGDVYYAMMPDLGGVCSFGCGFGGSALDNMSFIASHELAEAITDPMCPDMGVNPGAGPEDRAGWARPDGNEIGDLCVDSKGSLQAAGRKYLVEGEWDNSLGGCHAGSFTSP